MGSGTEAVKMSISNVIFSLFPVKLKSFTLKTWTISIAPNLNIM